jgi:phosphatidylglycerophosphate synthase
VEDTLAEPSSARARYRHNLHALSRAQKSPRGTAAYGRYVNRPAGRRASALLHLVGLTPNGATVISATLSGLGIALLAVAPPGAATGIGVAVLLAAGYVMDSVDGQLARLRGGGSLSGEWLDHTIDCFKTSLLHLAVLVSWYRFPPVESELALLVPLLYEVVQVVTFFGLILMPFLRSRAGVPKATTQNAPPENPLRTFAILPTDYGFLCWTFVLLAWAPAFFAVYSLLAVVNAGALALALRKWWRELRALDTAQA